MINASNAKEIRQAEAASRPGLPALGIWRAALFHALRIGYTAPRSCPHGQREMLAFFSGLVFLTYCTLEMF